MSKNELIKHVHVEKKAIRALGVAESFRKGNVSSSSNNNKAILAGVVMRSDLVIDGMVYGYSTIRGMDATESILNMYNELGRGDISVIMLGGVIISMYNIIDIEELYSRLRVPVIGLTFEDSEGLEEHIRHAFNDDYEYSRRIEAYRRLGSRSKVMLKTGKYVYVRCAGINIKNAKGVINKFLLQGSVPEPIRVARLSARALLRFGYGGPGGL